MEWCLPGCRSLSVMCICSLPPSLSLSLRSYSLVPLPRLRVKLMVDRRYAYMNVCTPFSPLIIFEGFNRRGTGPRIILKAING